MRWKKCRWIESLVMIVLLLILLYCLVGVQWQKHTGNLFFPFGYRPVVILSGSMEDTLATGAVVLVKETKDIAAEDILFFISKDGIPVIHRCIEVLDDGQMVTKGDANEKVDYDPVTSNQVQGKVVLIMNWIAPLFA